MQMGGLIRLRKLMGPLTLSTGQRLNRDFSNSKNETEIVLALKKQVGQGLADSDKEADANIDVLSLIHKSNARFTLSHKRGCQDGDQCERGEDEDKKHYAPQHRRFLTFPKVKQSGSFRTREKLDNQIRLDQAVSQAHTYQLEALGLVDQSAGHNALTNYKGLSSIVEDKIQLSILQGDFDNLKGEGKPQEQWVNPFVDRTEDMALEILKKNGVKPEWIENQGNMTILNNYLRSVLKVHVLLCKLDDPDASIDTDAIQQVVVADEELCHRYTDLYNLQVPTFTLTRGRISAKYELTQILDSLRVLSEKEDTEGQRKQLLVMLSAAQQTIAESGALVSRLRSERRGGETNTHPSMGHSIYGSYGSQLRQKSSSNQGQRDFGLSAGSLSMLFFMGPVDKLAKLFDNTMR